MEARELIIDLLSAGARFVLNGKDFHVISARGLVTDFQRRELAAHKGEILSLLTQDASLSLDVDRCPSCGAPLQRSESVTRWQSCCPADPLHFSEHRKKAGVSYLWEDVPNVEARHYQLTHLTEDELPHYKVRRCLVGCRALVKFYDGLGYCSICEVHQQIEEGAIL